MAEGKLIGVLAFVVTDDGDLAPVGEGEQCATEMQAKICAASLATLYAGVIAWSRFADPIAGEYGPPTILATHGRVPDHLE